MLCSPVSSSTKTGDIVYEFKDRKAASGNALDDDRVRSFGSLRTGNAWRWAGGIGGAEIWNVQPPRLIKRLDDAEDQTTCASRFSPDNRFLLGGSRDVGIFVWSLETGKVLRTLEREGVAGHVSTGSVAISPNSELVAAGPRQRATSSGDMGPGSSASRSGTWPAASCDFF